MDERSKERAGVLVAAILVVDGLLHAYWTTDAVWPAHDARSLSHAVLNTDIPFEPTAVGPLACLLLLAALLALTRVHRLGARGRHIPDRLLPFGILLIAAGVARTRCGRHRDGIGGRCEYAVLPAQLVLYTSMCLALFAAGIAAAHAAGAHDGLSSPRSEVAQILGKVRG